MNSVEVGVINTEEATMVVVMGVVAEVAAVAQVDPPGAWGPPAAVYAVKVENSRTCVVEARVVVVAEALAVISALRAPQCWR